MLLPVAPAAGEMTVGVNQVKISLDMRDVSVTTGTTIIIRADLTEPQKAGGDGDADINVELVVLIGTFLDDPSRQNLSGFNDKPDPIDDNAYPPKDEQGNEYDRYTFRFPETGNVRGAYAAAKSSSPSLPSTRAGSSSQSSSSGS